MHGLAASIAHEQCPSQAHMSAIDTSSSGRRPTRSMRAPLSSVLATWVIPSESTTCSKCSQY